MSMHSLAPIGGHFGAHFCDAQYKDNPSGASTAAESIFVSASIVMRTAGLRERLDNLVHAK